MARHAEGDLVSKLHGRMTVTFQVLSVNKALSIQSHPDKQLAERLHEEHPKVGGTRALEG